MLDREKVINGLECCANGGRDLCKKCYQEGPGFGIACRQGLMRDALELLKEQEPVEPLIADYKIYGSNRICANCTAYLFPAGKYCPGCGREVKWDD